MLKVTNGLVLQGKLEKWTSFDTRIIKEAKEKSEYKLVLIVLEAELNEFEKQSQEITEELAKEGIQYGEDYIITRVKA